MKPVEIRTAVVALTGENLGGCKVVIRTNPPMKAFSRLNPEAPSTWVDFFEQVIVRWAGFENDSLEETPFNRDFLETLPIDYLAELQGEVISAIQNPPSGSSATT